MDGIDFLSSSDRYCEQDMSKIIENVSVKMNRKKLNQTEGERQAVIPVRDTPQASNCDQLSITAIPIATDRLAQ